MRWNSRKVFSRGFFLPIMVIYLISQEKQGFLWIHSIPGGRNIGPESRNLGTGRSTNPPP
jgi:ligand-binding sensor domain-containing protein